MLSDREEGPHTGNLYDPSGQTAATHGGWEGKVMSGQKADAIMRGAGLAVVGLGALSLLSTLALSSRHRSSRHH